VIGQGQLFWYEIVARDNNGKLLFNVRVQAKDSTIAKDQSGVDKFLKAQPAVIAVIQIDEPDIKVGWTQKKG